MINFFKKEKRPLLELKNSLDLAESVIKDTGFEVPLSSSEHPIYLTIGIFAAGVQSRLMQYIFTTSNNAVPNFKELCVPAPNDLKKHNIPTAYEANASTVEQITIDFSKDLVFSQPWNKFRITSTLTSIKRNEWKQDKLNHQFIYLEPFKIASIFNGMHSGTTGILLKQGILSSETEVIDYSYLYDYVYTDGVHFYAKNNHKIISEVNSLEEAIIFEIGRLIVLYKQKGY